MLVLVACGGSDGDTSPTTPDAPLQVVARSSVWQTGGRSGAPVAVSPSVQVLRSKKGVAGITVTFTVSGGEGLVDGASQLTNANGIATLSSWKLGRIGVNRLTAIAAGAVGRPVLFEAVADAGPSMQARYLLADSVNVGTTAAPQWVAAGIRGDGRARDGQPVASGGGEYQGSFCGVAALFGRGAAFDENDNFFFDVARFWSETLPASCQPARAYRFYLDGLGAPPRLLHPLSIIENIETMTAWESRIQAEVFRTGAAEVGGIRFIDDATAGTSSVLVTRLPDARDELDRPVRVWRIESRGTHRALHLGNFSVTYYLPFSMTVTEVPYPFPTYP